MNRGYKGSLIVKRFYRYIYYRRIFSFFKRFLVLFIRRENLYFIDVFSKYYFTVCCMLVLCKVLEDLKMIEK